MNAKLRVFLSIVLFFFIIVPHSTYAQKYKTTYNTAYFLKSNGDSDVKLDISIANLQSDVYVREFTLSFPATFSIENVKAYDEAGDAIETKVSTVGLTLKILLTFSEPVIGKNLQNKFYITFLQKNLFKTAGVMREIILPTMNNVEEVDYSISVNLPESFNKDISIAKPKPTSIDGNSIKWNSVKTKTVYAVFGDSQYYDFNFTYHLKNDELRRVYYDIAFPPETLYQKVFINAVRPIPEKIALDEDGNYLARYTLNIKESKDIKIEGALAIFTKPQEDMIDIVRDTINTQKSYLLSPHTYWNITSSAAESEIAELANPQEIYSYVVKKLTYDYSKVNEPTSKRLGASRVLIEPTKAVCMEFTDLFIGIMRTKGYFAREMNGYGFSHDPYLQPLSLVADILHAWPEYYDTAKNIWVPVDPTWENTSGIDYFNDFDLNHIVFAIHGKDDSYPLAAGMYKIDEKSRDIDIEPAATLPTENSTVSVETTIKKEISHKQTYQAKLFIKNMGNVFIKNATLEMSSSLISFSPQKMTIPLLAPFQTIEKNITYTSSSVSADTQDTLTVRLNGKPVHTKSILIALSWLKILYRIVGIFAGIVFIVVIYIVVNPPWKRRL
ncbi:MAG TPA: transglutaminase domain-containing protein [Patescibacteria group bacterium]|nr:transglutaminase domain-containing protein [Patescibacteria group bacterium]